MKLMETRRRRDEEAPVLIVIKKGEGGGQGGTGLGAPLAWDLTTRWNIINKRAKHYYNLKSSHTKVNS